MGNTSGGDKQDDFDEATFFENVENTTETKAPDFSKTLNIAVIGKVSSGKSSLLNALLRRTRDNLLSAVDACSGKTHDILCFQLDDRVLIIDSPGLDDIEQARSELTRKALNSIDVALLVVTGSADASQRKTYEQLTRRSRRALVVLNKIDEWDHLQEAALQDVIAQWKAALGVAEVFPTCAKGFDPRSRPEAPYDLRGVDALRRAVESFLREQGKDLLLKRHMGDKVPAAIGIIGAALMAVAAEAFIPGSAVYITATQAAAIMSLYYLYTGKVMEKRAAISMLPTFMGRTVGYSVFLWAKSCLPPTGIVDAAAAGIAVVITLAMLATVNVLLASGHELNERERLAQVFGEMRGRAKAALRGSSPADWVSREFWGRLMRQFMYQ